MQNDNNTPDFSVEPPEIEYDEYKNSKSKTPCLNKEVFKNIVIVLLLVSVMYLAIKQ